MQSIVPKSGKATPRPDRETTFSGAGALAGFGTVTSITDARSLRRVQRARKLGLALRSGQARQNCGTGSGDGAGWVVHGYRVRFTDPTPCAPRAGRRRASRVRAYVQRSSVSASLDALVRQWLDLRGEGIDAGAGVGLHRAPVMRSVRGVRGGVV